MISLMISLPTGIIFAGIIVTLIILWYSLKRYEGHFSERKLFLSFLAGIAMGFVVFVLESVTYNVGSLYIILFPVVEQFSKFVILNLRNFQKKRETTIYGLSVGLGFGAIFVPLAIYLAIKYNLISLTISLLFGIGIVLFHGATGCIIGYGIASADQVKKWKTLSLAILLALPITIAEFISALFQESAIIVSLELFYSLILYWYILKKILPNALPRKIRKEINS